MHIESRWIKWVLVVALSAMAGFLLGSLSPFSVRHFSPFARLNTSSVDQVSFAEVAQRVNPSVVSVVSTKIVDLNRVHEDMDLWYPLRPEEEGSKRKSLGYGSGFIFESRGLVVTNQHVIDDSRQIVVRLSDGSEYPADLVGADSETDLALMKIRPNRRLEAARLGNSDELRVGDWVMAVGNPYNYEHSVTVGVVSAKDRRIDEHPFERYIQTDAAINFGNSGGPLFNARGEVVAITTAISTKGRNIGFAIPVNFAREIVHQLAGQGRVVRGFLGLTPEDITENHANVLQLTNMKGILVAEVSSRSAAQQAGIQRYDVITEIAGEPVLDKDDFRRKVAKAKPGEDVTLKGIRNGQPVEFSAEIRERPAPAQTELRPELEAPPVDATPRMGRAGVSVQELTDQHRRLYRAQGSGVIIVEIDPISPAADAGLSVGDVILEINRHPIRSLLEYQKLIAGFRANDSLMLLVGNSRGARSRTRIVALKLEEARPQ
ncbi:MAG: PDZ domain-containing protein [Acidimicrobiia bacterium]|nr:PDZ domain-containing protein [Acidimicrobiia bacterium]